MYKTDRFKRHKEYLKYSMPYAKIFHEPAIVLNKDGSMQATFKYRGPNLNSAIITKAMDEERKKFFPYRNYFA